ncbi:uncharacterized protein KY384_004678 [Bacidia gigantensis]|uniref:uncharacterized protein n=1 Tax=Bacidia gigantensis TaxID=2732470 RepID=UPI001D03A430|nr:uncharacterized protein KY384_004678 [Bacidia gigantensis]KAG8530640.1 hypothetical protein KY384_004678 [Bacidia gigantensis]
MTPPPTSGSSASPSSSSQGAQYEVRTLSQIRGAANSYSSISTNGRDGKPTELPIWFEAAGIVLISVLIAGQAVGVPPAPAGLTPLVAAEEGGFETMGEAEEGVREGKGEHDPSPDSSSKVLPSATVTSIDQNASHANSSLTAATERSSSDSSAPETNVWTPSSTTSPNLTSSRSSATSIASTASTSTGPVRMIFPKDGNDPNNDPLTKELVAAFGPDSTPVNDPFSRILMWYAPLRNEQVAIYQANPLPCVRAQGRRKRKRKRTGVQIGAIAQVPSYSISDPFAPADLVHLSMPASVASPSYLPQQAYVFDESAGRSVTVFIWDTGANPNGREYTDNTGSKPWILLPIPPFDPGWRPWSANVADNMDDDFENPHGGGDDDVFEGGRGTVWRCESWTGPSAGTFSTWYRGLGITVEYMWANGLLYSGKVVVNLSWGTRISLDPMDPLLGKIRDYMDKMAETYGVVFVAAAGNSACTTTNQDGGVPANKHVNGVPALWGGLGYLIIVTGAADAQGYQSEESQGEGKEVTIYFAGPASRCGWVQETRRGWVNKNHEKLIDNRSLSERHDRVVSVLQTYGYKKAKVARLRGDGETYDVPADLVAWNGQEWIRWEDCLRKRGVNSTDFQGQCVSGGNSTISPLPLTSTATNSQTSTSVSSFFPPYKTPRLLHPHLPQFQLNLQHR